MANINRPPQFDDVAQKVLRRAEVARMTRILQDRLALAVFKIEHGWTDLTLDKIEPKLQTELKKRKRRDSNGDTLSDTSSNLSNRQQPQGLFSSSPMAAPFFSDDIQRSGAMGDYRKESARNTSLDQSSPITSARKRFRANSSTTVQQIPQRSWSSTHRHAQSSPIKAAHHKGFTVPPRPALPFATETSAFPDHPSPPNNDSASDAEDNGLPPYAFETGSSATKHHSPPRTPPPDRARTARLRSAGMTSAQPAESRQEGADLLMFLATSPSPANPTLKARAHPPSTPPSRNPALPSSMMSTPGGGSLFGAFGAPNTPSQGFNFADFVNITPSPAQIPWNRTPATIKTPLAAREARRRLNFDALIPASGGSPTLGNPGRSGPEKEAGLGMELGGELVS